MKYPTTCNQYGCNAPATWAGDTRSNVTAFVCDTHANHFENVSLFNLQPYSPPPADFTGLLLLHTNPPDRHVVAIDTITEEDDEFGIILESWVATCPCGWRGAGHRLFSEASAEGFTHRAPAETRVAAYL